MAIRREQIANYLGLERNVIAASAAVFLLFLGEELWKKFLPRYLEALGAGAVVIGLFGTAKDFFDAIYQYPGGWLADRLGRRQEAILSKVESGFWPEEPDVPEAPITSSVKEFLL